jgi:putative hemolysin
LIKAYCEEKGVKLERFTDSKYSIVEEETRKNLGERYYPEDLQNLIEFIRTNCASMGNEAKIVQKAAPVMSSFCRTKPTNMPVTQT